VIPSSGQSNDGKLGTIRSALASFLLLPPRRRSPVGPIADRVKPGTVAKLLAALSARGCLKHKLDRLLVTEPGDDRPRRAIEKLAFASHFGSGEIFARRTRALGHGFDALVEGDVSAIYLAKAAREAEGTWCGRGLAVWA
jgi:hypothetical protein